MTDYHTALGKGSGLSVSHKKAGEIIAFIKGMNVNKAIKRLERVIDHKEAVPFKKFKRKIAHLPGVGPGKYHDLTCKQIINILINAKNNAINKGLQEEKLVIKEGMTMMDISKNKRIRSRKGGYTGTMRLTSIMITLEEKEGESK